MAVAPTQYPTSDPSRATASGPGRVDYEPSGLNEYTHRHRGAWSYLVCGPDAETLVAPELTSWLRLWGRFGAELYQCFRMGDAHIRSDMIMLARRHGGWRGAVVADSLERWRQELRG